MSHRNRELETQIIQITQLSQVENPIGTVTNRTKAQTDQDVLTVKPQSSTYTNIPGLISNMFQFTVVNFFFS